MKKFIGIAAAFLMLLSVLPVGALAEWRHAVPAENSAAKDATAIVSWDFETDPIEEGWQFIDADGDDSNWGRSTLVNAHSGEYMIASASYDGGPRTPDNWAVTPLTELPDGEITLSYAIKSYSSSYPETYRFYVGATDSIEDMEPVTEDLYSASDENWHVESVDLSAYAGQSVYIAIRHYNCENQWRFFIDDVEVLAGDGGGSEPIDSPADEGLIAGYYFEGDAPLAGWTLIGTDDTEWVHSDVNPGGYDYTAYAHEGSGFILSYSFVDYVGSFQADNWAITPAVELPEGAARVSFYATQANPAYPESIDVYVGTSVETAEMTLLQSNIAPNTGAEDEWTHYEIDLSDYAGQTIHLAFHDHCYDMYEIWLDQVEFLSDGGEPIDDDPYAIHEVCVEGWGTPIAGVAGIDHMFLTTPDGAPYYIVYGGWRDETDQQQMWGEEHVFIPGHVYSEGCQIWAEDGYHFAEDCVFYGDTDMIDLQWCYVDENDNWICYMNSIEVVCEGASGIIGDVDNDGDVDTADALMALRYAMGLMDLTVDQLAQADVDGDGNVTIIDSLLIARKALELINSFPVEE